MTPEPGDDDSGTEDRAQEPRSLLQRLPAPLRSEDAAFRMVLWAAAVAVAVAIVAMVVRALT